MHIKKPTLNQVAWYLRPFFWWQKRKYGQMLLPSLVWAQSPKLFLSVASLFGAITRKSSPISTSLRLLVTIQVSQINECAFCIDANSALLMKKLGSEEKIRALSTWSSSSLFSEKEKAALDYTEKVTRTDKQLDANCQLVLKNHFSEQEILELTAIIAFQNLSSKFNAALDIPASGFCNLDSK